MIKSMDEILNNPTLKNSSEDVSIESGVKGIDLLNPELRFVSDGKNLDVI